MNLNKLSVLLLGLVLAGQDNLSGQVDYASDPVGAVEAQIDPIYSGVALDQRLLAPPIRRDAADFTVAGAELFQRRESRLTYPLIGALVGGVAGAVYASIQYSGENALGFPVEPVLIFAPLGAIAGALAGAIIDPNAER